MHLVPIIAVLIVLAIAWHWRWVGGILFIALDLLCVVLASSRVHWSATLAITGPLVLVGVLFLLNWRYWEEIRDGP